MYNTCTVSSVDPDWLKSAAVFLFMVLGSGGWWKSAISTGTSRPSLNWCQMTISHSTCDLRARKHTCRHVAQDHVSLRHSGPLSRICCHALDPSLVAHVGARGRWSGCHLVVDGVLRAPSSHKQADRGLESIAFPPIQAFPPF